MLFITGSNHGGARKLFLQREYTLQFMKMFATRPERRFYREHKLLSFLLSDLERLAARTDFGNDRADTRGEERT